MISIGQALINLRPGAQFYLKGEKLTWLDTEQTKPTQDEINAKINELKSAEPMRLLREERNHKLAETDWRFRSDLTPSQEWIDYCQALRDLPSTASPELDENGQLINVTWPTKPE